jgi:hypothetical protein
MQAVKNRAQRWVSETLLDIRGRLPFALLGIDSDNGSEFINDQLFRYRSEQEITFTRTRPYRQSDNCLVERRTGPWCARPCATDASRAKLRWGPQRAVLPPAAVDQPVRPQQKLVSKTRCGARVTRRYDQARTPLQRLVAFDYVSQPVQGRAARSLPRHESGRSDEDDRSASEEVSPSRRRRPLPTQRSPPWITPGSGLAGTRGHFR